MDTNLTESSSAPLTETPEEISRRRFFEKLSIALVGLCTAIIGVPLIGFIVAPFFRKVPEKWVTLGKPDDFQIGKTVAVTVTELGLSTMVVPQFFCVLPLPKKG